LITENRLRTLARKNKVTTGLMEKDYVNSWILYSIFNNEQVNQKLVFKGGTLLHKIYFPGKWRFSEDLDLTTAEDIDLEEFKENLQHSLSECSSLSGIGFEITSYHSNPGYIQIKIQYDALLGQKNTTRIDVSSEEKILFKTLWKKHSLEDVPEFDINCYSLDEIFIEKIRSLFQRNRARDYYDVYRMYNEYDYNLDKLKDPLKEKMRLKNVSLNLEISEDKRDDLRDYWEWALSSFISDVEFPEFKVVMEDIDELIIELKEVDEDFK